MTDRDRFLAQLVGHILSAQSGGILRVAINGVDGGGKTRLADELALLLKAKGANVIRASIDGFHNPRKVRYARGKTSPQGFYEDSFNFELFQDLLLKPLSHGDDLSFKHAAFDHVTDQKVEMPFTQAKPPAILLVDGIFLFHEKLRDYFDLKIYLDVPFEISCARMAKRDGSPTDPNAAENKRYVDGQKLYISACTPRQQADILIDYSDFSRPHIL